MVNHPSLAAELSMHPPITITTVHPFKDATDSLFELGMLIRRSEALLMIEKR